jgi:pimeloyl-ACP methyl ester carboxylesterase
MTTNATSLRGRWPTVHDEWLDVGGRQVRVLRADAAGPHATAPQLLVHGLGGSAATWIEVMEGLAEHGPVVAVDLPGFGHTAARKEDPCTVRGYVDFVVEVADALGWDTFTFHGNSMGGLIGTHLAARRPERVDRLVLVSPALPPRNPVALVRPSRATIDGFAPIAVSSLTSAALGLLGLAGSELDEKRNRALLGLIYADPDGVDPSVLDLMAADFAEDDQDGERRRAFLSALLSIAQLWADPRRTWRAIDRVQAPTLLLGGTKDALVPARVLRSVLAHRPDWSGRVIDDRRHALMMEDPWAYLDEFVHWSLTRARAA